MASPGTLPSAALPRTQRHRRSFPSVVATELRASLLDYLRTTFKLQDTRLDAALFEFLQDPERGLFRGPYVDVRLPFVQARGEWRDGLPLDLLPSFTPYAHQLRAFERLGSRDQAPRATLITTGTGSGKTECFLYPLLDHCRRAREQGQPGIKALVLYPMNALASDQAARFAQELSRPELELGRVSAGLYVGGNGRNATRSATALIDDRNVLRQSPPDILLTNYKMLDLLLMRPADARLWDDADLQYLVLDELHSYDGAQGSDVACLIRRLKARLGLDRGELCSIGTSATLGNSGSEDPKRLLLEFAAQIFGEDFEPDAIVEEQRRSIAELFGTRARGLGEGMSVHSAEDEGPDASAHPFTRLRALQASGAPDPTDPTRYDSPPAYLSAQAELWGGVAVHMPNTLVQDLLQHPFLSALLRALTAGETRRGPVEWTEVVDALSAEHTDLGALPRSWQWGALASFLSLLSQAHSVDASDPKRQARPFLHVEVQLWVRELHGLLHELGAPSPRFSWREELPQEPEGQHFAPLLYCRDCGAHAVAATQRAAESRLHATSEGVGQAFFDRDQSARVVQVLPMPPEAALPEAPMPSGKKKDAGPPPVQRLCCACLALHRKDVCACGAEPERSLVVQVFASPGWPLHKCPECHSERSLTWLGSRVSTLCSVALSRWYASEFNPDGKLLAFTDSVQDASHRAGFFGGRAYRFSLRTALQGAIDATGPIVASQVANVVRGHWEKQLGAPRALAELLPADLREDPAVAPYLRGADRRTVPAQTWQAVEARLGFDALFELTLGISRGRSLEASGCATLCVRPERLAEAARRFADVLREEASQLVAARANELDVLAWRYLDGLTDRLRRQLGLLHPWLTDYARQGRPWLLSRQHNPRISHFPVGSPLPVFWELSAESARHDALLATTHNWYQDYLQRLVGSAGSPAARDSATGALLARRAESCLRAAGIIDPVEGADALRGLRLDALELRGSVRAFACSACRRQRLVAPELAARLEGTPCDRFRCAGSYQASLSSPAGDYYRRLYRSGRLTRVHTAEHTGLLGRHDREDLEQRFRDGTQPDAPNLLACTPTLEMGIDIGDLGNVMLCSIPPRPANYLQRIGRAGRKTGNALVVGWAGSSPHDQYFFAQPEEMLRGQVTPPGCFLDAPEMLARQMLAHVFDRWARDVENTDALPNQMRRVSLDKPGSFPQDVVDYYGREQRRLTEEFFELFRDEMSEPSVQRLRESASGLVNRAVEALRAAKADIGAYKQRIDALEQRRERLAKDPETVELKEGETQAQALERETRELTELIGAYTRLRSAASRRYPMNVLTDAGVLPNYAFPEPGVTLSALLRDGRDSSPNGSGAGPRDKTRRGSRVEYLRPASQALREFAPFNTFYAEGHQIEVRQLDLGSKGEAVEHWILCPTCHHAARRLEQEDVAAACPQCGDARWADSGQQFAMLQFRRALSVIQRAEAAARDETEERQSERYCTERYVDVRAEHYRGARLAETESVVFGYELLHGLELREINFGPASDVRGHLQVGGEEVRQQGFHTCTRCGRVSERPTQPEHAPTCPVRTQNWSERSHRILLYRSLRSEALRMLLPVSDHLVDQSIHTLRAALQLGFRKTFRGQPLHLQIWPANEVRGGKRRRFLVIYDTVPGGTGYLTALWRDQGFLDVLQQALRALQSCSYCLEHERDGCYRCLFAHQEQRYLPELSRKRAIELLSRMLGAAGGLKNVATLSDASLDQVLESELEQRFIDALAATCRSRRWPWQTQPWGGKPCYLLQAGDRAWRLEPQRTLDAHDGVAVPCRPDFVATCTSDPSVLPLAIFCDGLAYHACPDKAESRLGDDIRKRQAILDSGRFMVWSLTWKDLNDAFGETSGDEKEPPSLFRQIDAGKVLRADPTAKRALALRGLSCFGLLIGYLEAQDPSQWMGDVDVLGGALLQAQGIATTESVRELRVRLKTRAEAGEWSLERDRTGAGMLAGFARSEHAALLVQLPQSELAREGSARLRWTLRLFDTPEDRRAEGFEASWRAFLQAWNLLQLARERPEVLSGEQLAEAGEELAGPSAPPAAPGDATLTAFLSGFPEQRALAMRLCELGLPLPRDFAEVGDALPAELDALLCWPEARVALCPQASEADARAWAANGWLALDTKTDADAVSTALQERLAPSPSAAKAPKPGPRKATPRKRSPESAKPNSKPSDPPPPPARRAASRK
jgi:DEAD/DEAH box helicase domain-containing protein